MNCLKCGAVISGKYCPVCGAMAEENEKELQYRDTRIGKNRNRKKGTMITGIVLMTIQGILIIAGIISGRFAWIGHSFEIGVAPFVTILWLIGYNQLGIVGIILFKIGNRK